MTSSEPMAPASPGPAQRLPLVISTLAVFVVVIFAVLLALLSLRWPLYHDLPIFLYDGFLMHDLGLVPYRDFFEVNSPGTMVMYGLLHQVTQGDDLLLRLIDMVVLASLSLFTILVMRDHGWRSGFLAAGCFAIAYLALGPAMSLQREYICVLLLAISTMLAFRVTAESSLWLPMGLMGLLAGISICIKPPMLLLWVPLVLFVLFVRLGAVRLRPGPLIWEGLRVLIPFAIGLALPIIAVIWMLARNGALDAYLEIMVDYYPLYTQLRGGGGVWEVEGITLFLLRFVSSPLELFLDFSFLVVSFLGLTLAWTFRSRRQFVQCIVICGMVLMGVAYASTSGKFWPYHSFPLYFGLALLAGLTVSRDLLRLPSGAVWNSLVLCVAVAIGLPLTMFGKEYWQWRDGVTFEVKEGRVDLVAEYLANNTEETESVMVLDTTSGALHALYRIRRPLHGRFIYTFHVHHHIDNPYIQKLRRQMIAQFDNGEPDLVVRFDLAWGHLDNFPELDAILENNYEIVLQENDVSIFRRLQ